MRYSAFLRFLKKLSDSSVLSYLMQMENLSIYTEGEAKVEREGREFYIDKNGNEIEQDD